jgi:hypothetical protein
MTMKKLQYIYGILTVILVLAGVIFKVNHWPGASILLMLGIGSLLFIFLPSALFDNYKHEGNSKNLSLYIVGYLTAFVVLGGALFKILHWPGAGIFLMIALPFPFVVFLPVYLYVTSKIENFDLTKTVFVLFMMAHLSVFSALLALNVSKTALDSSMVLEQGFVKMQTGLVELAGLNPIQENNLKKSAGLLISSIDACENAIFQEINTSAEAINKDPYRIPGMDSQNAGWSSPGFGEPGTRGDQMIQSMKAFKQELAANNVTNPLKNLADQLLCPEAYSEEVWNETSLNWEVNIRNQHLPWVLDYLEGLKRSVYILQSEAMEVK